MNYYYCANANAQEKFQDFFTSLKDELEAKEFSPNANLEESTIILSGGDGTLNYFLQNLDLAESKNIKSIIYFPAGTANDFARSLSIPTTIPTMDKTLSILEGNKRLMIPLMSCNEKIFINAVSIGAPAKVTSSGDDLIKKVTGKLSYYLAALEEMLSPEIFELSYKVDDGEPEQVVGFGALVSQGLFAGGGVKVSPSYTAHFGESFGFTTVDSTEVGAAIGAIFETQSAETPNSMEEGPLISRLCQRLELSSERDLPLKIDGEAYSSKRVTFQKTGYSLPFLLH